MEHVSPWILSVPRSDHFLRAYFCATRRLLCLSAFSCFATGAVLKIRDSFRMFPNFSRGTFSHVTHLEQSRASKNVWRENLVEPKYPWRDQTSLICYRSVPNRYDKVLTVPKFSPKLSVIPSGPQGEKYESTNDDKRGKKWRMKNNFNLSVIQRAKWWIMVAEYV